MFPEGRSCEHPAKLSDFLRAEGWFRQRIQEASFVRIKVSP